jgi:hypothetical protein
VEGDGEAVLDGADGERDGAVRLPDPGRSLQQEARSLAEPRASGERLDAAPLDARLEGEVEVAEGLAGREPGELEGRPYPSLVAGGELGREQAGEEAMRRRGLLRRRRDVLAEALGGMEQPASREALARPVEVDLRRLLRQGRRRVAAQRATSARGAERSIGRRGGGSAQSSWRRRPIRPSGGGASPRAGLGPA